MSNNSETRKPANNPTPSEMLALFNSPQWAYLKELWGLKRDQSVLGVLAKDPVSEAAGLARLQGLVRHLDEVLDPKFEERVLTRLRAGKQDDT